jgi:hypothetical protein
MTPTIMTYDVRFAQILYTHFHFVVTRGFGLACTRFRFWVPVPGFEHLFPVLSTRSRFWAPVSIFMSLHLRLFLDHYMTFEVVSDGVDLMEHAVANDEERSDFAEVGIFSLTAFWSVETPEGLSNSRQFRSTIHDCIRLLLGLPSFDPSVFSSRYTRQCDCACGSSGKEAKG